MTEIDGYITDLSLDEAIKILDALFLNPLLARSSGKTRMVHNQALAWIKVRGSIPQTYDNIFQKEKESEKN